MTAPTDSARGVDSQWLYSDAAHSTSWASNLASKCAGAASGLTYNEDEAQATLKWLLKEASHYIDTTAITVTRRGFRWFLRNARGCERRMPLRMVAAYYLMRGDTKLDPRRVITKVTP